MSKDNKLLDYIVESGKQKAKEIVGEAERKKAAILENAEKQAALETEEIRKETDEKIRSMKNVALSNASLVSRNTVLKAKRAEIDKTIDELKNYISSLADEEYFALIYRLASKNKVDSGSILLNDRDLKRLPSDFEEKMAQSGVRASVCPEPADISSGFILKDGEIEFDCSVDAVIEDNRNEIEDFINESIFKEN